MFARRAPLFLLLAAVFVAGFLFSQFTGERGIAGVYNREEGKPEGVDFSLFWDAWRTLQENYVASDELDERLMLEGALSGMVESAGDPYTVYFNPGDTKVFWEDIAGTFEGVGMEVGIREGELKVIAPLEGTPAQKAGLRPGDTLVKIEDTFARDLSIDEAVVLIRGEKGTVVRFLVLREGWAEAREFSMERAVIEVPSLSWRLQGDVAVLSLYHFSEKAKGDFQEAAMEILASRAETIVLDLRNNPGGFLEVAQDIAGWFLERGAVVTIEEFGDGRESREYRAKDNNAQLSTYPIVVLVNGGTASAAEILAGALHDNRGVLLVGERSFGKGSVQELKLLKDDSSLKITVAHWLTPKGNFLTDVGLEPDVAVPMTEDDFAEDRDPQLDKALELVEEL